MSIGQGPSTKIPIFFRLVAAVGGVGTLGYAWQATKDPKLAILYFAAFEVVVFVFGLVGKVWGRLEKPWLDVVADRVDRGVRTLLADYDQRYRDHIRYRHRDFDVKGLTTQGPYNLELAHVFVELAVVPQPAHQASTDPIRELPQELRSGHHPLWAFLKTKKQDGPQRLVLVNSRPGMCHPVHPSCASDVHPNRARFSMCGQYVLPRRPSHG